MAIRWRAQGIWRELMSGAGDGKRMCHGSERISVSVNGHTENLVCRIPRLDAAMEDNGSLNVVCN